jgi:hypothetical protein
VSTQAEAPRFPDWFVPNCPPRDATDAAGEIYRFVSKIPCDPDEFLSYHETEDRSTAPPCQRCGLSVFRKVEDVRRLLRHLWRNYAHKNYGPHIVKRELTPADGKFKPTGSQDHHSWWAYEGVERHALFDFVETVPKN